MLLVFGTKELARMGCRLPLLAAAAEVDPTTYTGVNDTRILGSCLDDAPGEAFDKARTCMEPKPAMRL